MIVFFITVITVLIFLLIVAVLFVPINIIIGYDEKFYTEIKVFSLSVDSFFKNKSISEKKFLKKNSKNKRKYLLVFSLLKHKGFFENLRFICHILQILFETAQKTLRRTTVKELTLNLGISGSHAFETSIRYGKACELIYGTLAIIESMTLPKETNIHVYPDYLSENYTLKFKVHLQFIGIFMFVQILVLLKEYFKYSRSII